MDDATLVKAVAAQYVRDRGPAAIPHLREMQKLAAGLSDDESVKAWRDIEDAAQTILSAPAPDSSRPQAEPRAARPFRALAK
jgi:hypothetical protein